MAIDYHPPHSPCLQCGNKDYIVPYKRTNSAVICSQLCWNGWLNAPQLDSQPETEQFASVQ